MAHETIPIITNRWNDSGADGLTDLDTLVTLSRLVGADPQLVVWGGGNTSIKTVEPDFRGRETRVLRVKGSGSDLKAVMPRDFPAVRMEDLLPLMDREAMTDEEMVSYVAYTMLDAAAPRPSIETLLHAFVPARCVVHSHADAILSLVNNDNWESAVTEVFGDELTVIPYRRPGFVLSKWVGQAAANPALKGVILFNHGLVTWHDKPREAYNRHIEMADRAARFLAARKPTPAKTASPLSEEDRHSIAAAIAPTLRGLLGREVRVVTKFHGSEDILRFLASPWAEQYVEAGAATPDHILSTKWKPLWVAPSNVPDVEHLKRAIAAALENWRADYAAYFEAHNHGESALAAVPRVIYVRGIGMFTAWNDSRGCDIAADIARHTISIVSGAQVVGRYRSLSPQDAFDAEYWPLELYKLSKLPPEKPLSRRVALITGAAGAIGSAIAKRFAAAGAHVICTDVNAAGANALADELNANNPPNRALAVEMDVTSEASVRAAFEAAALEYGGVDVVVFNAGVAPSGEIDTLDLATWQRSLDINTTGHFLVAREAMHILKEQATGGSLVFIATKNVPSPGKGFGAYSAAKAAMAQLARVLALEGGEFGIRSNIVNPDAVFEGSGLWTDEVRADRAQAYGIKPSEIEEHYRARNILRADVTAEDVAEAALFFASDLSAKTTGAMVPVDGGLKDAFPR